MRKNPILLKENKMCRVFKQTLTHETDASPEVKMLLVLLRKYWQHIVLGSTGATTGTSLVHHIVIIFDKWPESLSLLWPRYPGTNRYIAKASTSWLLENIVVFSSASAYSISKVTTTAISIAATSAVTDHSPGSFCKLVMEQHLGLLLSSCELW